MEHKKAKFPAWIHLVLGIVWVLVGIIFQTGIELAIWVTGGIIMIIIGILSKKK
ncbi:MAG: hypothetical protein U9P50_01065 [Patescibacteria group bacterium]|nr:hypothetical protein [Patescibacteria group bacterium]